MDIREDVIEYWISLCTRALDDAPSSSTLFKLYKSLLGIYRKHFKEVKE